MKSLQPSCIDKLLSIWVYLGGRGVTDWWRWQNKLLESYFIIKNTLKKKSNWDKEKELDTPLERQTVYKALKISKCCVSNADHQD